MFGRNFLLNGQLRGWGVVGKNEAEKKLHCVMTFFACYDFSFHDFTKMLYAYKPATGSIVVGQKCFVVKCGISGRVLKTLRWWELNPTRVNHTIGKFEDGGCT